MAWALPCSNGHRCSCCSADAGGWPCSAHLEWVAENLILPVTHRERPNLARDLHRGDCQFPFDSARLVAGAAGHSGFLRHRLWGHEAGPRFQPALAGLGLPVRSDHCLLALRGHPWRPRTARLPRGGSCVRRVPGLPAARAAVAATAAFLSALCVDLVMNLGTHGRGRRHAAERAELHWRWGLA